MPHGLQRMFTVNKVFRKDYLLAVLFLVFIVLVTTCEPPGTETLTGIMHPAGLEFAGSETCVQCHSDIAHSFRQTPHFQTSAVASDHTVKGSFDTANNILVLNERLKIVMEKSDTAMYQTAFVEGKQVIQKPFHISLGSGRMGQTYLYWQGDSLFQLPASYHAASNSWANSPGYATDRILFDRSITARCLECHTTYFKAERLIGEVQTFDKTKSILGVDCERCHGPAARHVNFHQNHPDETSGKFISEYSSLTRKQRLDNCALCHSGIRNNFLPSFSYLAGDDLDRFFFPAATADSGSSLDVHGNQTGLLASSKCFRMSEMDCSTCHDVHAKESKKLELFSARCMTCHEAGSDKFCKQTPMPGLVLSKNCIDCHMPALPSKKIFIQSSLSARPTPFYVRTHLVATYKKEVEAFLEKLKESN